MSDYSFLKTGFNQATVNQPDTSLIKAYASIFLAFTEHGLKHAGNYTIGKGRNTVKVDDIKRGLKYEMFKFMDRHDNLESIDKWKQIIDDDDGVDDDDDVDDADIDDDDVDIDDDVDDEDDDVDDDDDIDNGNIGDEEDEMVCDNSEPVDIEQNDIEQCDIEQCDIDHQFMKEMDNIDDRWHTWVPQNEIEDSLMKRINEMR